MPRAGHSRPTRIGRCPGRQSRALLKAKPIGRKLSNGKLRPNKQLRTGHWVVSQESFASGKSHRAGQIQYGIARHPERSRSIPTGRTYVKSERVSSGEGQPGVLLGSRTKGTVL